MRNRGFQDAEKIMQEYRRLAKRANQRILRVERTGFNSQSVKYAKSYIERTYPKTKSGKLRFPETLKGESDFEKVQKASRDIPVIMEFLEKKTSRAGYVKKLQKKRDEFFASEYGVKSEDELYQVLAFAKEKRQGSRLLSSDRLIFMYKEYKEKGYTSEMLKEDIEEYRKGTIDTLTDIEELRGVKFLKSRRKKR